MPDFLRFIIPWHLTAIPITLLVIITLAVSLRFCWKGRAKGIPPYAHEAVDAHMQDGVLILDHRNRLVEVNPAAARILGKPRQAVVGKPISEVQREIADIFGRHPVTDIAKGQHTLPVNGLDMAFKVSITPVRYGWRKRTGRMAILSNVTGWDAIERTLHQHTRELTRSNKLITALSNVATRLGGTPSIEAGFEVLGAEIRKLGLDCGIVVIDPAGKAATIKYLSFDSTLLKKAEKLTGVSAKEHAIPRHYWPGDRILKEKQPIWYPNPHAYIRRMFPQIPEILANRALRLLGIQPESQICILPLLVEDKLIGAMPIWGADLHPTDNPVLELFARQIASVIQATTKYEIESERADQLARSNSLILALSKVAAQLESSADSAQIFNTVGKELQKMGMESIIGTLDVSKQNLHIEYLSIQQDVIRWAEKMTRRSLKELSIPRRLWPTEVVVNEKVPYWDPNRMRGTLNMFPILPENLHKIAMKMAGISLDDPVCYLPLANEHEVIGVLAVWGAGLKQTDISALSVLASQVTTAIRNSELFKSEARRAKELGILLKASEATSSASQFNDVLLSLASTLLGLSGFESCYISEWNRETNTITGLMEHSRVWWRREKRESYSLSDYAVSRQVLLTGNPVILQGEFDAEEKKWMDELGRSALVVLAMKAGKKIVGLVEIASTREKHLFEPHILNACQNILEEAAESILEPLSENDPKVLFALEETLLKASGGEVCSISEWDQTNNCVLTLVVSADLIWAGQGTQQPEEDAAWKLALHEGKTSLWVRTEEDQSIKTGKNSSVIMDVESTIIFPLQKGNENIGLIELYDFNHKRNVTPEQLTLLRTVADKASYSIQNARLLQQAKQQLEEKTALLNEKEVLLKEVHHRVKNNLQVISSLLNLQAAKVKDPDTKDALRESQNRVRTMALIHEKLYQSSDLAQVNFKSYLQSLVTFLTQSYRERSANVTVQIEAEDIMLDIDAAIPCGLIVNELVSNSLKYAFPENQPGSIKLTCCQPHTGKYILVVGDDGVGLPEGFDIAQTPSLGYKLVVNLASQLDGKLELLHDRGTTCRISFERIVNTKNQNFHRGR